MADSKIMVRVKDYVEKISFFFSPILLVIVGASLNALSLDPLVIFGGAGLLVGIMGLAVLLGMVIPVYFAFKNWREAIATGLARFSPGGVGMGIAGVARASQVISDSVYLQLTVLVLVTSLIIPRIVRRMEREKGVIDNQELEIE